MQLKRGEIKVIFGRENTVMRKPRLTPREKIIAQTLLQQHNNKMVARALGVSLGSIAFHATTLRSKMGVQRTIIAAYLASEMGLLD